MKKQSKKLDIKLGSPYEAFLTRVRDGMVTENTNNEMALRLNKALLGVLDDLIQEEKRKFK